MLFASHVGARVAIATVNFFPEVGLYNGTMGNIIEIVYHDRPVGPNDKQHYHLPDYIVVDIPHPLVPAWATTIHKFQGMEAGFDKNDQFQQLICHGPSPCLLCSINSERASISSCMLSCSQSPRGKSMIINLSLSFS